MAIIKYAFLTECQDGTYEVFHLVRLLDDTEFGLSRISRFETALTENKQIIMMDVSNFENAAYNASWDGSQFTIGSAPPVQDNSEVSRYALLYDNVIFFILGFDKGSITDEKFKAAISQNTMVINATEYSDSIFGWIWNGTELYNPNNV